MQAVITNATSEAFFVSFMYKTLAAGESVTITDTTPETLAQEVQFKKDVEAGYLTVAFAEESFDNFVPQSVDASDIQTVAAAAVASGNVVFRQLFTAPGGGGSPDDITVVALGGLTSDMRVLEAYLYVSTAVGASTAELRTVAGGGGTLLASFDTGTTGKKEDTSATGTVLATASGTTGLFLYLSDDAIAGEIVVVARPEA